MAYYFILNFLLPTGLSDFSWSKHTKTGKIYQMDANYTKQPQIVPNDRKIFQHCPFQGSPNCDFWFENKPSGNPCCQSLYSICLIHLRTRQGICSTYDRVKHYEKTNFLKRKPMHNFDEVLKEV
jgi:hypothetical protein